MISISRNWTALLRAFFWLSVCIAFHVSPISVSSTQVAAARQIKFIPPIKDGRFVSMFIQIEYNFRIY